MPLNTTNIFVRCGLLAAFVFMFPIGVIVILKAFEINQPHVFVMLIFSGSFTALVGMACLVGFISSYFISGHSDSGTNSKLDDQNLPSD